MTEIVRIPKLPVTDENCPWWYRATIKRIVDGDTYDVDWDRGGKEIRLDKRCRGSEYDTYEQSYRPRGLTDEEWALHKEKGKAATAFVETLMPPSTKVIINTMNDKEGNFARLLVRVYIPLPEGGWIDLAETLRANKHLKP